MTGWFPDWQTAVAWLVVRRKFFLMRGRACDVYSISSVIILGSPVTILGFIDRLTSIDLAISTSYLYSRRSQ